MVECLAALDSSRLTTMRHGEGKDAEIPIRGPLKPQALGWMENYYLPRSGVMRWVDSYLSEFDKHLWEEWKQNHQVETDKSPPMEDMLILWKLHQDVKFIANLYVRDVLPIFTQSFRSDDASPTSHIQYTLEDTSSIERQRILRGIYRFVIFGNLFAPSTEVWTSEELCENFLCRFPSWEVEEISCINDFIRDRITQKWKELGDDEPICIFTSQNLPHTYPESEADERRLANSLMWSLNYASALPIQELRAIFQARGELLKTLVVEQIPVAQDSRPFLDDALCVDPEFLGVFSGGEHPRSAADSMINEHRELKFDEEKGDAIDSPNFGMCWGSWHPVEMYCNGTSANHYGGEDYEGLRRAGYVFWDITRWGDHTRFG